MNATPTNGNDKRADRDITFRYFATVLITVILSLCAFIGYQGWQNLITLNEAMGDIRVKVAEMIELAPSMAKMSDRILELEREVSQLQGETRKQP